MTWDKITEMQNPVSSSIDEETVLNILKIINSEDLKVPNIVKKSIPSIASFIRDLVFRFRKGGRLFYIGSGTSGRLGVLDASECPPTFGTDPKLINGIIAGGYGALIKSVENAEDSFEDGAKEIIINKIDTNDTVLGISSSSSTPFVLGALKKAKAKGAMTGLIISNKKPNLDYVDHEITAIVGAEVITGSTRMKAGTASKLILNMITTTLMIKMNKTYGNLMVDLNVSNKKLYERAIRIVAKVANLERQDSIDLLARAKGKVKVALVINNNKCSYKEAVNLLKDVQGNLKEALKK